MAQASLGKEKTTYFFYIYYFLLFDGQTDKTTQME